MISGTLLETGIGAIAGPGVASGVLRAGSGVPGAEGGAVEVSGDIGVAGGVL